MRNNSYCGFRVKPALLLGIDSIFDVVVMRLSSVCSIKPAVVTPYFDEDRNTLDRCIKSVADQSYSAAHFLIADGKPQLDLPEFDIEHLILPAPHRDYGNTPRCIGALSAINRGFNAIFFLDADNWYESSHVEEAIRIKLDKVETDVVASSRKIILPDNIEVSPDADEIARNHVDTSCMALFEEAFSILPLWATMTPELSLIGDRVIFGTMKRRGFKIQYTNRQTVNYSSNYKYHYERARVVVPSDAYELDLSVLSDFRPERFKSWNGFNFRGNIG